MAAASRAEMVMLREALERVVAPEVATALLFEALERSGGTPPASVEAARALAGGPLADAVRRRVSATQAAELLEHVGRAFDPPEGDGVAVEVEVDAATWDSDIPSATRQMAVVRNPVPVVVLADGESAAERLLLCLGEDRVRAVGVGDDAALRKAVFACSALIVLVDAVAPARVEADALTAALRGLPDNAMAVLWGSETGWARALVPRLEAAGVRLVTLDRREGLEPLLDLVLARFRGDA